MPTSEAPREAGTRRRSPLSRFVRCSRSRKRRTLERDRHRRARLRRLRVVAGRFAEGSRDSFRRTSSSRSARPHLRSAGNGSTSWRCIPSSKRSSSTGCIRFEPEFFRGKRVLDAGCGIGRHAYYAATYGASEVVALDLSGAVETARRNLESFDNVDVVQGDLLRPPFRTAAQGGGFDLVYSIGVLHHLPDPHAGFRKLVEYVRPGGTIAVWVYGHENNGFVRNVVEPVRRVSTKLPPSVLRGVAWPLAAGFHGVAKGVYRPLHGTAAAGVLPLENYMTSVAEFSFRQNYTIVFDQLVAPTAEYIKGRSSSGGSGRAVSRTSGSRTGTETPGAGQGGLRLSLLSASRIGRSLTAAMTDAENPHRGFADQPAYVSRRRSGCSLWSPPSSAHSVLQNASGRCTRGRPRSCRRTPRAGSGTHRSSSSRTSPSSSRLTSPAGSRRCFRPESRGSCSPQHATRNDSGASRSLSPETQLVVRLGRERPGSRRSPAAAIGPTAPTASRSRTEAGRSLVEDGIERQGAVEVMPTVNGLFTALDLRSDAGFSVDVTTAPHATRTTLRQTIAWIVAALAAARRAPSRRVRAASTPPVGIGDPTCPERDLPALIRRTQWSPLLSWAGASSLP